MAKLAESYRLPWNPDSVESEKKEDMTYFLKMLIRKLMDMYGDIATEVNNNYIDYVSQNGQPTPANGKAMIWKDADATTGNPTHYLVFTTLDGDTVTFASEELVP